MARPNNHNGGRPKIKIDWKEFDQLCYMQCTLQEIADWFHCSPDTLERRLKEEKGQSFAPYFEKKRVGGKIALRRNLMKMSEKHSAVAIFLAKNWLGMKDKQEIEHSGNISKSIEELSDEELTNIITSRRSKRTSEEAASS